MKYFLDTDICSYFLKNKSVNILKRIIENKDDIYLSSVVCAELLFGVERNPAARVKKSDIRDFFSGVKILPWSFEAAEIFGEIRANLEAKGTPIGQFDMMIGAHSISEDAVLVTNNLRDFSKIPNLKVENWI